MGIKIAICLPLQEYQNRAPDMQYFLRRVQEFYGDTACQIKRQFPIGDSTIRLLQVINPNVKHSEFLSLVALATNFFYLLQNFSEWRRLGLGPLPFEQRHGPGRILTLLEPDFRRYRHTTIHSALSIHVNTIVPATC